MIAIPRSWVIPSAILFGFALTVAVVPQLAPKWIQGAGLDVWNAPLLNDQLKANDRMNRELTIKIEECDRRYLLKRQIIDSLLDGEVSLREATSRFLSLNQSQPAYMMAIRKDFRGDTDLEKMARNVLSFTIPQMRGTPAEKAAVFARLKNEFQELTGASYEPRDNP